MFGLGIVKALVSETPSASDLVYFVLTSDAGENPFKKKQFILLQNRDKTREMRMRLEEFNSLDSDELWDAYFWRREFKYKNSEGKSQVLDFR